MSDDWANKFSQKLEAKQQARKEARRDFSAYAQMVRKLFTRIEAKIKAIEAIHVERPMLMRTDQFGADVDGPISTIKSMKMSCEDKSIELIPEGINFDYGKGRVRILHGAKELHQYIYLYLVVDEASPEEYPGNLDWVLNDEDGQKPPDFPSFDDAGLEQLIEKVFL